MTTPKFAGWVHVRIARPVAKPGAWGRRDAAVFTVYCLHCPMRFDFVAYDQADANQQAKEIHWRKHHGAWLCPICWNEGKRGPNPEPDREPLPTHPAPPKDWRSDFLE